MGQRTEQDEAASIMPAWAVACAALAAGIAAAALGWGAWHVGQTWDENAMADYTQGFFLTGWFTDASAVVDNVVNPGYAWLYAYGPIANLVAHAGAVVAGTESWSVLNFTSDGFAWRHLMTAVMGFVGVAAVAGTVKVLLGSWRWALAGASLILVTPLWLGHSMFNIKDVPVASGFSLAVLGGLVITAGAAEGRRALRHGLWGAVLVATGTLLAAGTRPAIGVAIAGSVLITPIGWVIWASWKRQSSARGLWWQSTLWSAGGLALAYLALMAIYPRAFLNPLKLGYEALIVSGQFPFDEPVLTAGNWMEQPPPASYLPLWFGSQLPIVILVLCGIGVVLWVMSWLRRSGDSSSSDVVTMNAGPGLVPLIAQATTLPVLAIVLHSSIYNGSRQFLFVVPAVVVIATVGLRGVMVVAQRSGHPRGAVTTLWAAVLVLMAIPLAGALQLLPYSYTYMNAGASLSSIDGRWPTDYWRASSNELMRRLPAQGPESCAYEQAGWGESAPCADQPMFRPYLDERGMSARDVTLGPGEYWLVRENQGVVEVPSGCTVEDTITRMNLWREVTIGQILRCSTEAQITAR